MVKWSNKKWVQKTTRPTVKIEENPIERIMKKVLEERVEHELKEIKTSDVDNMVLKLREMIVDEQKGISEYTKLSELFISISLVTGMLGDEAREIKGIAADEARHKKLLERTLFLLTTVRSV